MYQGHKVQFDARRGQYFALVRKAGLRKYFNLGTNKKDAKERLAKLEREIVDGKVMFVAQDSSQCVQPDGIKDIHVDLGNVAYLDSSALGMLLVLREKVTPQARIDLVNCNKDIRNILEISNFQKLFTLQ